MGLKIYQIIWEALSVLLLLYGVYLFYAFLWFSVSEIAKIDITTSKILSGIVAVGIIAYSTFKWFKKKKDEIRKLEEQEGN